MIFFHLCLSFNLLVLRLNKARNKAKGIRGRVRTTNSQPLKNILLKKLLKQKNKTAKNNLNHRMRHLITASFHPVVCPGHIRPYSCLKKG